MRNGLIGLASAMVLASTMATAGCGRTGITARSSSSGGAVGTGGSSGTGGTVGTGGSSGSGGTVATGGSSGSGGTVGTGGSSGSGGTVATGGSSGSGGTVATGRSSGSGGTVATGGSSGTGGTVSTGGSSGTGGGGASCSNVLPCGGDIVGKWTVTSSCLTVTGQTDMSLLGLGCSSALVTGSLDVTGTWTAKSNGTYSDNTTTSGTEQLTLPASCLNVSGTTVACAQISEVLQVFGYDLVTCTAATSGGCKCPATVKQTGGIGLVSYDPQTSGDYKTSGNLITTDGNTQYSYCVSGDKMTWTPQSTSPTTTGTVVFQKQ
jgi:hypothetical protein